MITGTVRPRWRWYRSAMGCATAMLCVGCTHTLGRPDAAPSPEPEHTRYVVRQDVVYTPSGWPQALSADLYMVEGQALRPAVVVVHGGGWNGRDRGDMDRVSRRLAERGYVVANIDYRLVPAFRHPAQVEDVKAAIAYLRDHAAELRVDPGRIGGWGYSAGAHLVALAATADGPRDAGLRAVVAGGMPADFERYPGSPVIQALLGRSLEEDREAWRMASPIHHVSRGDPPMFLYHGTFDKIVQPDESLAMHQRLQQSGVHSEVLQLRGLGHIATFLFSASARTQGIEFLDRYLRGDGAPTTVPR